MATTSHGLSVRDETKPLILIAAILVGIVLNRLLHFAIILGPVVGLPVLLLISRLLLGFKGRLWRPGIIVGAAGDVSQAAPPLHGK